MAAMGAEATVVGCEEVLRAVAIVEVVREVVRAVEATAAGTAEVGATVAREVAAWMAVGLAVRVADLVGGGFERGGEGALTTPYEILGRSERTTKCCSSSCSDGVKQLMSVPTARRTARPDVGEPSGTLAVTTILIPRCSSSIISSARPPAPHASMAASSALLGSGPASNGGVAAVASIRADGPFEGTPPPMVTLKVTRSMRANVGSKDTIGAANTRQVDCQRSMRTSTAANAAPKAVFCDENFGRPHREDIVPIKSSHAPASERITSEIAQDLKLRNETCVRNERQRHSRDDGRWRRRGSGGWSEHVLAASQGRRTDQLSDR